MIIIRRLFWDEWSVAHVARHKVTPDEAEEVCHGAFILLRGKRGRLIVSGPTKRGRLLAVVLDPEGDEGEYYPVTARSAAKKERRLYQQQKGGAIT
jgi:uncharacterized DUF497 family protein